MTKKKEITLAEVKESLDSMQKTLDKVEQVLSALVHNRVTQMPSGVEKRRVKLSKKEKDAVKKELLKGVPYGRKGLEKLENLQLRMLGSAINVNTFGKPREEAINMILGAEEAQQKESGKKK